MSLPLSGIRVVEWPGLAPGPFTGMVLADFGATVTRIDKVGSLLNPDVLCRGKRSLAISPKTEEGRAAILKLYAQADVVIDPFRPGVLERLGLGPKELEQASGGKAILARLSGFRRTGPHALAAGHDINYLALSGVLSMIQPPGSTTPVPPLNLAADFAGGALICVIGILMALLERARSGKGQVVEADMVTGTRYLASFPLLLRRPDIGLPMWTEPVGQNVLDGGAPFYQVYACKDGRYISVGCIESHFYAIFLDTLTAHLDSSFISSHLPLNAADQMDRDQWPIIKQTLGAALLTRDRDDWARIFLGTDACVAAVLEPHEVDHLGRSVNELDGEEAVPEQGGAPEPAPRLSRTPARSAAETYAQSPPEELLEPGRHTFEILREVGLSQEEIDKLVATKSASQAEIDASPRAKL